MTAPDWSPPPNPGGEFRWQLRQDIINWLTAQAIPGIEAMFPTMRHSLDYQFSQEGSAQYACVIGIEVPSSSEQRQALTGPNNYGGKDLTHDVVLAVRHQAYGVLDAEGDALAQQDFDRVVDAIKTALRGPGRDLGRPDTYYAVGDGPDPGSIRDEYGEPVTDPDSGTRSQRAGILFSAVQYLNAGPTSP